MVKRRLWLFGLAALFVIIAFPGEKKLARAADGNVPELSGADPILYLDGRDKITVQGKHILSVKYTSSKNNVATVSSKGVILPKRKGKTKIQAKVVYRKKSSGKKYTKNISYSLNVLGKAKEYVKYEKIIGINEYYIYGLTKKGKRQKELYIPDYAGGKKITRVAYALDNQSDHLVAESLYLADGIQVLHRIAWCDNLKKIRFGKKFEWQFFDIKGCPSLNEIVVDSGNKKYFVEDGVLFYQDERENKKELVSYPRGKKDSTYQIPGDVIVIRSYSFEDCQNLKGITIPESVYRMEEGCFAKTGLTSIHIPDTVAGWDQEIFSGCTSLKDATLSGQFSVLPYTVFQGCTSLQSITLPAGITCINYDGHDDSDDGHLTPPAFMGCTSLTEIKVSDASDYFSSIDGVLYSKDKKVLVYYPEGKKEESYTVCQETTEIQYRAFVQSKYLQKIVLPDGLQKIGYEAFCKSGITEVIIPDSLNVIGQYAFSNCKHLVKVKLPDHPIKLDSDAFLECSALRNCRKIT